MIFLLSASLNSILTLLKLLEKGMIVRDLTGYGLNAIRVTIGTNEQNTKLFKLLDEVLEELK